eukprot:1159093-Pelagomonas_calceolata.AAC.1
MTHAHMHAHMHTCHTPAQIGTISSLKDTRCRYIKSVFPREEERRTESGRMTQAIHRIVEFHFI